MKKVLIHTKEQTREFTSIDPTDHLQKCIDLNVWGLPERIVEDIEGSYDEADVIEKYTETLKAPIIAYEMKEDDSGNMVEVPFELEPGIYHKTVKLKAEYTIDIIDMTYEHELDQCIQARIAEYPQIGEFLNAFFDGPDSAIEDLQAKRLAVKQKYPKPVKEL